MWQNMLAQIRNYPTIIQQYDIAKIFAWVASLGGLKNIQQFRLNPMDGSGLASQMQAGNLVPMKDAMTDLNRVPDPNRAEGMGLLVNMTEKERILRSWSQGSVPEKPCLATSQGSD